MNFNNAGGGMTTRSRAQSRTPNSKQQESIQQQTKLKPQSIIGYEFFKDKHCPQGRNLRWRTADYEKDINYCQSWVSMMLAVLLCCPDLSPQALFHPKNSIVKYHSFMSLGFWMFTVSSWSFGLFCITSQLKHQNQPREQLLVIWKSLIRPTIGPICCCLSCLYFIVEWLPSHDTPRNTVFVFFLWFLTLVWSVTQGWRLARPCTEKRLVTHVTWSLVILIHLLALLRAHEHFGESFKTALGEVFHDIHAFRFHVSSSLKSQFFAINTCIQHAYLHWNPLSDLHIILGTIKPLETCHRSSFQFFGETCHRSSFQFFWVFLDVAIVDHLLTIAGPYLLWGLNIISTRPTYKHVLLFYILSVLVHWLFFIPTPWFLIVKSVFCGPSQCT